MSAPRHIRCASVGQYRRETSAGRDYLVVPVVALIGGATVEAVGSDGPETVPGEVLEVAANGWNGRPVTIGHPQSGKGGANNPKAWEAYVIGTVFESGYRGGKLRMEAWIDEARCTEMGGDAARLLERVLANEPIEVSVGAWVAAETDGTETVWIWAEADHLALLPEGQIGACSREMGCGVRAARTKGNAMPNELRAAAMAQARRPTFSGTESSTWTKPTWADYVKYLHEGADGPASIADAPTSLRRAVAAHSLLGDPEASTLRDLAMFPVVNPSSGKLNENALRAVLGSRGAAAEIPGRALESARDMARRLLNSEFGAEIEAERGLAERISDAVRNFLRGRSAQTDGEMSEREIHEALANALREKAPGFVWVEENYPESTTCIFSAYEKPRGPFSETDGPMHYWRVGYSVDKEARAVAIEGEPVEVERHTEWIEVTGKPETASPQQLSAGARGEGAEQDGAEVEAGKEPASAESHEQRSVEMADKVKALVGRLLAAKGTPWKQEDAEKLEAFGEQRLEELCKCAERHAEEPEAPKSDEAPKAEEKPKEPETPVAAVPEGSVVLPAEEVAELRAAAKLLTAQSKQEAAALVARLAKAQAVYSEADLKAKGLDELRALARILKVDRPVDPDYSALGLPFGGNASGDDEATPAPPDPYKLSGNQKGTN